MGSQRKNSPEVSGELGAVREQVLSLADIVESVFADAILALVEGDFRTAREVRLEDYKAHKVWLETDSVCVDLLARGELHLDQVRFVAGAIKIAMDLKRMADEAVRIARHMSACPAGEFPAGPWTESLPPVAEVTQSMFTACVQSLVSNDPVETECLRLLSRQQSSLNTELLAQVNKGLGDGTLPPAAGTALVLVSRALEEISQLTLEVANHVRRLYPERENEHHTQDSAG